MIKQFNTAIGSAAGSKSGASSKGGNALIWIAVLGVAVFAAYKFIENRNRMVVQDQN